MHCVDRSSNHQQRGRSPTRRGSHSDRSKMEDKDMVLQPYKNAKPANNKKLFISGIGMTIGESELCNYFSQYGEVEDVVVIINPLNGFPKGYGFVKFIDAKSVDDVMQTDGYHIIANQRVEVKRAVDSYERSNRNENSVNMRRLFVGGIDQTIGEHELYEYFRWFGKIDDINIKFHPHSGEPKGYGFVQFVNVESAFKALRNIFHNINNTMIEVRMSRPKDRYSRRSKIFVGGLTPEMTEYNIMNYFGQFGEIIDFYQPFDVEKNQKKNFCFVTFKDSKVADKVLKNRIQVINGSEVNVNKVKFNPGFEMSKNHTMCEVNRPLVSTPVCYNLVPLSENVVDFNSSSYNGYGYAYTEYNYKNVNVFYPAVVLVCENYGGKVNYY